MIAPASCLAILIGAGVATGAIPDRPEKIDFAPLNFTPPKASQFRHVLSNGVPVYMAQSHEFPLIDVTFAFKGGSYLEPADKVGLASMTGRMMRDGGTTSVSAKDVDEKFDFLAANASVSVRDDFANASLNSLTTNFDEAFALFMDMLRHPGWDADRLRLAKDRSIERMKQRNDDAATIARRTWARIMWGPDSYEAREATQAMIESITPDDLSAMHDQIFQPGNLIIGVSGDFDEKEMLDKLERALSGWDMKTRVGNPPAPTHELQPGLYSVQKDIPQGRVQIGHRGVERYDPDAIAIDVMNDILGGGGFTSRIMKTVRNDEGLAYGARTRFADDVWFPGEFVASFQSKSPTVALGIKLILKEMEKMRSEPVTEKELETSQKSFIETFPRRFESKPRMLQTFINDEFTNRPKDWWQTYRDRVRAVTAADVQRAAEEHLHPSKVAILVVGNWDKIYPGDIDGRASMADFYSGNVTHLPLLDPLTLKPLPMDEGKDKGAGTDTGEK